MASSKPTGGPLRAYRLEAVALAMVLLGFLALYASTIGAYGMFTWDEAEYASLGRSLLRGQGFSISDEPIWHRLPLLPAAVAAALAVSGSERDAAAKRATLLFCLLALLVVHLATREVYGPHTALAATVLLGLMPSFWSYSAHLLTEIPFLAFFTGALVTLYLGLNRDARLLAWSGGLTALALLTRYTAVLLAPLGLLFAAVAWHRGGPDVRARLTSRHFAAGIVLCLTLVGGWLLRQQLAFGDALIGFRYASTQLQNYLPQVTSPWFFYLLALPWMTGVATTLLVVLGVVWILRHRDRFGLHCLLVVVGIVLWFSAYRFKEPRQIMATLPFLAVIAALGLTKLVLAPPFRPLRLALLGGCLLVVGVTDALPARARLRDIVTLGYPSFLQAAEFLRQRTPSSAVVLGENTPQISWYADRRAVSFPPREGFAAALAKVDWVLFTNFERGQPAWAAPLAAQIARHRSASGEVYLFRDPRFATLLARSSWLASRLSATEQGLSLSEDP